MILALTLFIPLCLSSSCCDVVKFVSDGDAAIYQSYRLGVYRKRGEHGGYPYYTMDKLKAEYPQYLYYLHRKDKGRWVVGPTLGMNDAAFSKRGSSFCAVEERDNLEGKNSWKYVGKGAWQKDTSLRAVCESGRQERDQKFVSEEPVDGDNEVEDMDQKNTFAKIKSPRIMEDKESAVFSVTSLLDDEPVKHLGECLEQIEGVLLGGDLPVGDGGAGVYAVSSKKCGEECTLKVHCRYYTWIPGFYGSNCFLKGHRGSLGGGKAVSGSDPEACRKEDNEKRRGEIRARFRLLSPDWTEELRRPRSSDYQQLARRVERSLEESLQHEEEMGVAKWGVQVEDFYPGSFICGCNINFTMDHSLPILDLSMGSVTEALEKVLREQGIQLDGLQVDKWQIVSKPSVCDTLHCSHGCDYIDSMKTFLCSCPKDLRLVDGTTCQQTIPENSMSYGDEDMNLQNHDIHDLGGNATLENYPVIYLSISKHLVKDVDIFANGVKIVVKSAMFIED